MSELNQFKNSTNEDDPFIEQFLKKYNQPINEPYIIGISGGSGAGKSHVTNIIVGTIKKIYPNRCNDIIIISQDSFYKGGNASTNYDIPSSIEFDMMINCVKKLINGESINCPIYDFSTHSRMSETKLINPAKIIIIEGILIFTQKELRDLCNLKVFVHAEEHTQLIRRAQRDTKERGRTYDEVFSRYTKDVGPSYKEYVLPFASYADMTINNRDNTYDGVEVLVCYLLNIFKNLCDKK